MQGKASVFRNFLTKSNRNILPTILKVAQFTSEHSSTLGSPEYNPYLGSNMNGLPTIPLDSGAKTILIAWHVASGTLRCGT